MGCNRAVTDFMRKTCLSVEKLLVFIAKFTAMFTAMFMAMFLAMFTACPAASAQNTCPGDTARSDSAIVRYIEGQGFSVSHNNSLVLLPSGKEKFHDMFAVIAAAKNTVHLEYFNFRNDSIAGALFELLKRKVSEGVKVRVLYDAFGNASNNRPIKKDELKELRASGMEIYEYYPMRFPWVDYALHRDHRKIVVVDGAIAYTGGMNVADYYINGTEQVGNWRDMHMRVEGDVVGELQSIFLRIWNKTTGQNIRGNEYFPEVQPQGVSLPKEAKRDTSATRGCKTVAVVNREPRRTPRLVRETFVKAIDCAQDEIDIVNPYFTLNRKLRRALKRAVKRGVNLRIMVSENSDIPITPRVVDYNVRQLQKKGATVYYYRGGFHHSKIMTVDGRFAYLGSANLNARSLSYDYECNLLVVDTCTVAQLHSIFENDARKNCIVLDDEYWHKQRSAWKNFQGWLFHFLEPFL